MKATKANVADAWSVYDALGNRVATKVNDVWQFVIYDAFGKLVAEYGTQGEGLGGISYVLQDWQGSVRASVNNNGFIQARFDFTAFGEEVSLGVGLRSLEQGYTGDATTKQGYGLTEKDSSGQNHTWFRKQEQRAGRWTSPDPFLDSMNIENPQSFNRFNYVENDAINFIDPDGLNAVGPNTRFIPMSLDPMGVAYYIDGMLCSAYDAWGLIFSGGGLIAQSDVQGLTVITWAEGRPNGDGGYHFNGIGGQILLFTGTGIGSTTVTTDDNIGISDVPNKPDIKLGCLKICGAAAAAWTAFTACVLAGNGSSCEGLRGLADRLQAECVACNWVPRGNQNKRKKSRLHVGLRSAKRNLSMPALAGKLRGKIRR